MGEALDEEADAGALARNFNRTNDGYYYRSSYQWRLT